MFSVIDGEVWLDTSAADGGARAMSLAEYGRGCLAIAVIIAPGNWGGMEWSVVMGLRLL